MGPLTAEAPSLRRGAVTMRCRTNLKKEKRLRNRINAFRFKKGTFNKFSRLGGPRENLLKVPFLKRKALMRLRRRFSFLRLVLQRMVTAPRRRLGASAVRGPM